MAGDVSLHSKLDQLGFINPSSKPNAPTPQTQYSGSMHSQGF